MSPAPTNQAVYDKLCQAYQRNERVNFSKPETQTLYHLVQSMLVDLQQLKQPPSPSEQAHHCE